MLNALGNVKPSHLLDGRLFDFKSLSTNPERFTGNVADELDAALGHFAEHDPKPALVNLASTDTY